MKERWLMSELRKATQVDVANTREARNKKPIHKSNHTAILGKWWAAIARHSLVSTSLFLLFLWLVRIVLVFSYWNSLGLPFDRIVKNSLPEVTISSLAIVILPIL